MKFSNLRLLLYLHIFALTLAANSFAQGQAPEPTPTPPYPRFSVKCEYADNKALNGAWAKYMARGQMFLAQRLLLECKEYLKENSGSSYGSFSDTANAREDSTAQKLTSVQAEFNARRDPQTNQIADTSPMRDLVVQDKYFGGASLAESTSIRVSDGLKFVSDFWDIASCVNPVYQGACWSVYDCDPWCNFSADLYRSYRWPVQVVEAHRNRGDSAYIQRSGLPYSMDDLRSYAEDQITNNTVLSNMRHVVRSVAGAKNELSDIPIPDLPNVPDVYNNPAIGPLVQRFQDNAAARGLTNREARAVQDRGTTEVRVIRAGFIDNSLKVAVMTTGMGALLWYLGGPCHKNKYPAAPFGTDMTHSAYGWSARLGRDVGFNYDLLNSFNPNPLAHKENDAPYQCLKYSMRSVDGGESLISRLQVPPDLFGPAVGGTNAVRPLLGPINPLTKDCGTGNQQNIWATTVFNSGTDQRTSSQKALLKGLNAVTLGVNLNQIIKSGFYSYVPDNEDTGQDDRFYFMHDKYQRERFDSCKLFDPKLLEYDRTYEMQRRDRNLESDDINPEEDGDGAWGAGYHFKRFRCCKSLQKDDIWLSGKWCVIGPCDWIDE